MTLTLAGLTYRAHSPSMLELKGYPVHIGYSANGSWYVHTERQGWIYETPLASREAAAQLVARAFEAA